MDGMDRKYHVWCLLSDGEHQEGMTWEAAMFAGKNKLSNLTAVIDRNNIQIDGVTEDIMPLEPLREKYEAFNWHVMEMNSHNMREIVATLEESKGVQEKPVFIIANTIPGKGVDFMENHYGWHGVPPGSGPEDIVPKERQFEEAMKQLKEIEKKKKDLVNVDISLDININQTALQEYAEALCYYHFIKNNKIPTAFSLKISNESYLLGLCDLTGELVRKAVNDVIKKNFFVFFEIRN